MSASISPFTIVFPPWYDAQMEFETPSKGYLRDVEVHLEDGSHYRLYFIDPVRLQQTLTDDVEAGRPFFAEPGLVVLPEVTTEAIHQAIPALVQEGYFSHLRAIG